MLQINIDKDVIHPKLQGLLVCWLDAVFFDKDITEAHHTTEKVIEEYKVGYNRLGESVFWRIDKNGQPQGGVCSIVTEHGDMITTIDVTERLLPPSSIYATGKEFFGGHLVTAGSTICVVPNEVKCLELAGKHPDYTWLAVGYGQDLCKELLAKLTGCRVILFPTDLEEEYWREVAKEFNGWIRVAATFCKKEN